MSNFAEIILPLAIPKLLTYQIPAQLSGLVTQGSRVIVPLGKTKILTGIIESIHEIPPSYSTKDIIDVLDEVPITTPIQIEFFQWIAQYYLCTLGEVIKTALPNGFKLSSQSKIQLHPEADLTNSTFSEAEQLLISALKKDSSLTYPEASKLINQKNIYKLLKALINKKTIILFEEIHEKYQPKKEKRIRLNNAYIQNPSELQNLFDQLKNKHKQIDVLLQYLTLAPITTSESLEDHFILKKQLLNTPISSDSLQKLIKQEILIEKEVIVPRLSTIQSTEEVNFTLSPAQDAALESIKQQFGSKDTVLLYGITGSGKTEIYIQLIQEALQGGGQILYLLPEIGLATQIVKRLKNIFGDQMGVYHSKYSSNERVEIWNNLLQEKVSLIIGVRSALFLPFYNLSLIIVDEEHEFAYKQLDAIPRYHARDAALMLAKYHHAKVLLGSATPAIETYHHAQSGKYGFVRLKERFNQTPLPNIMLANVRLEKQQKKLQGEFTEVLLQAIKHTLEQQEQVIIFQNRRGYAPYLLCQACAWVPTCERCSVSLTYHQSHNHLICHYCGYRTKIPPTCSICDSPQLNNMGFGTEKLEETLHQFFPDKHIQRMDLDTTRRKHSYEKIIERLEQGHTDILVGTQMITKGLDFGQVSLVGVMDVDKHLYFPDFRANERCFQLITQVSGRAGRRNKQGKVIIQTANPNHPILQDILHYDYEQMYLKELAERQNFLYPPYVRLIKITLQHLDKKLIMKAAGELAEQLRTYLGKGLVLGPQDPLIAKIKNQYRMDIWVKIPKSAEVHLHTTKDTIQEMAKKLLSKQNFRPLKLIFDVDPV